MLKNILLVGLGGFLGSIARYLFYLIIEKKLLTAFPISTFTVNVLGSLILGLVAALFLKESINEPTRLLLAVGFCGSFTTFSTFAFENLQLLNSRPLIAISYTMLSLVVGLVMVFAGYYIGKQL